MSVDEIEFDEYRKFANGIEKQVVAENPVCQKCNLNPSACINRWGKILAVCRNCFDEDQKRFDEYCREQEELSRDGCF